MSGEDERVLHVVIASALLLAEFPAGIRYGTQQNLLHTSELTA